MIGTGEMVVLLALPFAACVVFIGVHAYLGIHVLRRQIIFADLALAQLSALGATVAFALGHPPTSLAGFAYTFGFTALGAVLLAMSRSLARRVGQEAFIGILYVVATALTVIVVDRLPQGAEHVKAMLVGSILTVEAADLEKFAVLYGALGGFLWLARRPIVALSETGAPAGGRAMVWDFLFYLSFGLAVTSSVAAAGVLLVFCFLIIPAVIGSLFAGRIAPQLAIGWVVGAVASALGLLGAFELDLPTGAALVVAFALALVFAGLVKYLAWGDAAERRAHRRRAARAVAGCAAALLLASSLWLMAAPEADQPLLDALEAVTGIGPMPFLSDGERTAFVDAVRDEQRYRAEVERLNRLEQASRYQGPALGADEVRRLASYMQSFNEMQRGERFVQATLRARARLRARWYVGVPLAILVLAAGALLLGVPGILLPRARTRLYSSG
ncbi:MAG: metal ABC transporter permease [Proteobacteria bacterium]|nr:metal ABC transporter permease [Pseudomonadota bacterium]